MTATVALPLRVGPRTLARLSRKLIRVPVSLEAGMNGTPPDLPSLPQGADGFLVTALPAWLAADMAASQPGLKPFVRQRYQRSYASLEGSFDDYLAGFSAKTRSTLRRKLRKFAEVSGGSIDLRCYRTPEAVDEFYRHARAISATTYQERLLEAGLPSGAEAVAEMRERAGRDAMRGWVLFLGGEPVSYLYAPADGDTLLYHHLGYHPAHAPLSPGTVLQLEAMRGLMEEGRFRLFDFTEGDGQHKRQFGTGWLDCVDLLLVRPRAGNLLVGYALLAFDKAVALAKAAARAAGVEGLARSALR
ncbi:MAG TPA: GNAT family N-acetyltransferase [Allosphingosinicella sp.]|nr:GNAT family N-acetyltransferase [Allosphingosinicella sp.]